MCILLPQLIFPVMHNSVHHFLLPISMLTCISAGPQPDNSLLRELFSNSSPATFAWCWLLLGTLFPSTPWPIWPTRCWKLPHPQVIPHLSSRTPDPSTASPCQLGSGPAPVRDQRVTPAYLLTAALTQSPQPLPLLFPLPLPCLLPWSILWPLLVPPALWRQTPLAPGREKGRPSAVATSTLGLPPSRLLPILSKPLPMGLVVCALHAEICVGHFGLPCQ